MGLSGLWCIMAAMMTGLLLSACEEDYSPSSKPIQFDETTYEVRRGFTRRIPFKKGSADYTLTESPMGIADISVETSPYMVRFEQQKLVVTGVKEGSTTLTIHDNEQDNNTVVTIDVTIPYLGFYGFWNMGSENLNDLFSNQRTLFLCADYRFYLFDDPQNFKEMSADRLVLQGCYSTSTTDGENRVAFSFTRNGIAQEMTFKMSDNSADTFEILSDWEKLLPFAPDFDNPENYLLFMTSLSDGTRVRYIDNNDLLLPRGLAATPYSTHRDKTSMLTSYRR